MAVFSFFEPLEISGMILLLCRTKVDKLSNLYFSDPVTENLNV